MLTTEIQGIGVSRYAMDMAVSGDGRPLALVGGGLTGSISWIPHAEKLAETRRVGRLQPLNVQLGLEGRPLPDGCSIAMESAALQAALDDAGWTDPLDLVAWSYGALIALDFALAHPDRIRTLTLIEPPAIWVLGDHDREDSALQSMMALEIGEDVDAADLAAFLRSVGLVPPGASPSDLPQWGVWMKHRQSLRMLRVPLGHEDDRARLASFDKTVLLVTGTGMARFAELNVPIWLLLGSESPQVCRDAIETLQEALPNSNVIVLRGQQHLAHHTAPELLAKTIRDIVR